MAKGKKFKEISNPVVVDIVGFTAQEQAEHYKRDYEFNKAAPVRSPVKGWEYKYASTNQSNLPSKEISLIRGVPHKFGGVRSSNSYGNRTAMKRIK